jgi:hypothetical protein
MTNVTSNEQIDLVRPYVVKTSFHFSVENFYYRISQHNKFHMFIYGDQLLMFYTKEWLSQNPNDFAYQTSKKQYSVSFNSN